MKKGYLTIVTILIFLQSARAQWTLSGTNISTNPTSGNVQIGLTSPTIINASSVLFPSAIPKLEILTGTDGAAAYSEMITLRHTGIGSGALSRQLGMLFKLSNEGNTQESNKMGGIMVESSSAWANHISLSLITAGAKRLTIDETGNVGVGTNDPWAKLTVYASSVLGGSPKDSVLLSSVSGRGGASNTFKNNIWLVRNSAGSDWTSTNLHDGIAVDGSFGSPQTDTKTWWERNPYKDIQSWGNAANTYLSINKGNVGVGVIDTKGYKLAVNGGVIATAVTVKLNSDWPDYVFKRDYKLPSLAAVKTYIDQHQHLPEIPSEQEIVKKGLDLGEMNKVLVKKVEELTLYLLEQKEETAKQAQLQEARIKHLEERLNQLVHSKNE
ncbi:hypothetical protein SNE25_08880 [Mucilaginibacter sabulilitoris]|uniref:BZIP transcription factor n=1 Tax=Mucilaginibacter sabulilitoris TaxID=1173583 RepID=A0ABZ0TS89_9SPHI|nr:hypothetical protein [Mucilaginibacter sabulilitoris]WPU95631.1 hypothetical protein SNE25_08880 [Mucilaginibacter sabulilitoris]